MIFVIILFIFGLSIGSFINALEYRITEKKTIGGRSFCPHCKHQLTWYDLIPLFSFAFLAGKCRYCKKKISWQYPTVEFITAITFAAIGYITPLGTSLNRILVSPEILNADSLAIFAKVILTLVIFSILIIVALHDAKTGYILSTYVYVASALATVLAALSYREGTDWLEISRFASPYFWSALVGASVFFALYFFSKGKWMGAGDSELAILMGLFLGFPAILVSYYTAFIVGSIWALIQMYVLKTAKMKSAIPLGPFLVLGVFVAHFAGPQLVSIYVKMFLGV